MVPKFYITLQLILIQPCHYFLPMTPGSCLICDISVGGKKDSLHVNVVLLM